MMTGPILGGSSVQQAAKLQMIIMFMITASTTLASFFVTFAVILVVVDEHRIRSDRIYEGNHGIYTKFIRFRGGVLRKFRRICGERFRKGRVRLTYLSWSRVPCWDKQVLYLRYCP